MSSDEQMQGCTMAKEYIKVWADSEQGIEQDTPLATFFAPKSARQVLEVLRQHCPGNCTLQQNLAIGNITLIGDDNLSAGDYFYSKVQGMSIEHTV